VQRPKTFKRREKDPFLLSFLCYTHGSSGHGAAWLARLHGVQEVVGSNPAAPTKKLLLLGEFLIHVLVRCTINFEIVKLRKTQ
jgi:hypothetical protein